MAKDDERPAVRPAMEVGLLAILDNLGSPFDEQRRWPDGAATA